MISHNPNVRPDAAKINGWVKNHILNLPSMNHSPIPARDVDYFSERSLSSPAKIVNIGTEEHVNSSAKKKGKHKFFKTQSVM